MSNKAKLDIAILTAGRSDLLKTCIERVLEQTKSNYSITVYNNGSPSQEYEEIYKLLPKQAEVKRSNTNEGFSIGANKAIKNGKSDLVFFITDDVFIHPNAIETLLKRMEDKSIALCGYKLIFPEDSTDPSRPAGKVQHAGMESNIKGGMIHPLIGWSSDNPKVNISKEVLAVTGASFMVRRDAFNRSGGFNPIYGKGYYEDMDLCFTIRSQGGRIFYESGAVATHGVGQTFKDVDNRTSFQQNQMTFRGRWLQSMPWSEWESW